VAGSKFYGHNTHLFVKVFISVTQRNKSCITFIKMWLKKWSDNNISKHMECQSFLEGSNLFICAVLDYIWGAFVFICGTLFLSRECFHLYEVLTFFYMPVILSSFIIGFLKRKTPRVQEQLSLPEHLISCYSMAS
jgi:hypothetical protein